MGFLDWIMGPPSERSLQRALEGLTETKNLYDAKIANLRSSMDKKYFNLMKKPINKLQRERSELNERLLRSREKEDSLELRNYDIAIEIARINEDLMETILEIEDARKKMSFSGYLVSNLAN